MSAFSVAARALHHRAARVHAADEADLRDLRVRDERGARVASAGHDVEDARWKHVVPQLGDAQRRERRLLRGLHDQRIARDERRAAFARGEEQRMIERADARDDAQRLAQRVVERAGADRDRVALDLGDEPGEIFHVAGADLDVETHRLHRIAGVDRLEPRELVGIRAQDRDRLAQRRRALLRRRVAPRRERRAAPRRRRDRRPRPIASTAVPSAAPVAGLDDEDFARRRRLMPRAAVIEAAMLRQARVRRSLRQCRA